MAGEKQRNRGSRDTSDDKKQYRATTKELFTREISAPANTSEKIYSRDSDNKYPERMERVINNSPTGRRCANLMAKYIGGNGNKDNFKVGKKGGKDIYINDILRDASIDIAYQYGVYFKLKYSLDAELSSETLNPTFKTATLEVLDYVIMAKSKEDDNDYPGKFYALEDDEKGGLLDSVSDENPWFYPYNSDSKIILAQMKNDCRLKKIENPTIPELINNYRGQVYYMNLTPKYIYALPLADSVYNDLDTEFRISNYNNVQTRTGFLGKTVFVKYGEGDEDSDDFADSAEEFLGSENSGSVFIVEVPQEVTQPLDKAFIVQQLKPQFDDKLFESTVKNIRQSIMGAFNNIPEPLVFAASGSLFGTSADTYTEMKKFYWEQNEWERSQLEQTLKMFGYNLEIVPIVNEENLNKDEETQKQAQATLKGSVGGVTALMAIQKSVSDGITDVEAAIAIIVEIYGIDGETARKMLGTPKKIENE